VPIQFDPVILDAVQRASKRSSAVVREEMKGDVYCLATIASIAPWFGILARSWESWTRLEDPKTTIWWEVDLFLASRSTY